MRKLIISLIVVCIFSVLMIVNPNITNLVLKKSDQIIQNANVVDAKTKVNQEKKVFTSKENQMLGIKLKMFKEEVVKILGKPIKVEKEPGGAYLREILKYYYKFGSITLDPYGEKQYIVSSIKIDRPNYKGVRDTQVNDSVESILQKFPYNKNASINEEGEKWIYGSYESNERGLISYNQNGDIESIRYSYGKSESINEYSLTYLVKNNRITHIYLAVCLEI